jgi:hypothetical protein
MVMTYHSLESSCGALSDGAISFSIQTFSGDGGDAFPQKTSVLKELIDPIVHFFSSAVAYDWVRGAKTTGPIVKKFGFS